MQMKERVENILGKFLERNKDYAVHAYIRNGVTGNNIADVVIPMDRNVEFKREKLLVVGNVGHIKYCNGLLLFYNEILGCYEERDEYDQQMVYVFLKNGMKMEFDCVGMRM